SLFVPIGFWRGAQREIMVTLGILLGAALADWWAHPWGSDLANLTSLRDTGGAFMVAVLFLIGSTFLLGYGAGAALPVPPPGLLARILGAIVAAGNGALILSFALRDIRVYLLPNSDSGFLDKAVIAHFLSTGVGWILLAAAVAFLPIILMMAIWGQDVMVADDGYVEDDYEVPYATAQRRYPPRGAGVPPESYDSTYKAEPPRSFFRSAAEETRQMVAQPNVGSAIEPRGNLNDMQTIASRDVSDPDEATQAIRYGKPVDTAEADAKALEEGKCPNCHADIRDAEVYCPRCGRVL
ncbi:MAG TPA: CvpA family protein, partial [Nitrolancea sp.]